MTPPEFIQKMLPAALACQREHGIPASFTIGQAALESSWGRRVLGNNLFGIKADRAWTSANRPYLKFLTKEEFVKGVKTPIYDIFRVYTSWDESIADRADFFLKNPRYKDCFRETTGEGWARAVAADHYATASDYADRLIAVMRGRNLGQYDK